MSRIWPQDRGAAAEATAELQELGYPALWLGSCPPTLELPQALLAATSALVVATGIVSVWDAPPATVAAAYHRVSGAHPGRFLLGLGAVGQPEFGKLAPHCGDHPARDLVAQERATCSAGSEGPPGRWTPRRRPDPGPPPGQGAARGATAAQPG